MTHQSAPSTDPGLADAGAEVARLLEVLALVEELAGRRPALAADDAAFDRAARISAAHAAALPIDRRRFDGLAVETARWAAACVEALLVLRSRGRPVAAAAARLADELAAALRRLSAILPA